MARLNGFQPWRTAALSHVGRKRAENQDCWLDRPDLGLWAVADGMGGHADGRIASRTVCRELGRVATLGTLVEVTTAVDRAIATANTDLLARAASTSPGTVIGTTVAALFIHSGYAVCVWCGDSRVHLVRRGEAFLLTRDHTPLQDMLDRGEIDYDEARGHRASCVVSRAVGVEHVAEIDHLAVEAQANDRFLLCTDGISRHVTVGELAGLAGCEPERTVRNVVDLAKMRGATDDVTAVAVNLPADELPA